MPDPQDTPTIVDNDISAQSPTSYSPDSDPDYSPNLAIQPNDPRLKPLKPQQRIFAMAFGLPGSTTFGHGMKSYQEAYPGTSDEVAKVQASKLLTDTNVSRSVAEIINSAGLGVEVRADSLKRIISHRDIGRVVSRVKRNEEEGTIETITESGPSHVATLKAIEVLNKMDGTYERGRVAADVARDEYRELRKRFFSTMDRPPKAPQTRTVGPAIDAQGQAGTQASAMLPGQLDTRRGPGQPRKAPKPPRGGGLSTRARKVVSSLPEAGEILQGEGI
jgi:hypothetical protein